MKLTLRSWIVSVVMAAISVPTLVFAAVATQQLQSLAQKSDEYLADEYRVTIKKIVVLPSTVPANRAVTGSYNKQTDGLLDGIDKGRGLGTIDTEIGGIQIPILFPILTVPGAIFGGLTGAAKRRVQDLRDALTADLDDAVSHSTLSNDALATDVFWRLREVPGLMPKVLALRTPIPEDSDAILYVSFSEVPIEVDGDDVTITLSAAATLRRFSDGQDLYSSHLHYQDKDTLTNWTKNDNATWHDFVNYARHYLGREIAEQLYERVDVKHTLQPKESTSVERVKKNNWNGVSWTTMPTLAWELSLDADNPNAKWAANISTADVTFDVEVYDLHQLVYAAKRVANPEYKLEVELEACKVYRWTVRPTYRVDGSVHVGAWMRSNPGHTNGNIGASASVASAYIYDFASLEIKCGSK